MTDNKIIEKIKKLLALATSDNINEATRAMEQAQRLMASYSITEDSLSAVDSKDVIGMEIYTSEYFAKQGVAEAFPTIATTIAPIFGVYLLCRVHRGKITSFELYGFSTNLIVARYALDSILIQGIADAKKGYKKYRTTTYAMSFWSGFAIGIKNKFSTYKEASTGLTVYNAVRAHIRSLANTSIGNTLNEGIAKEEGIASGLRAELRKGIQSESIGKLLE